MLAVLLGLGTWQVERLHWKQRILAQIATAEAAPPVPLHGEPSPFAKVAATGTLRNDLAAQYGVEVRDTRTGPTIGAYLIEPLERPDGPPVLVERGWVPAERSRPLNQPRGTVTVTGYVHPAEHPGWFSAADDPATRTFYTLDPAAIGAALGLPRVAPFVLVALGPTPPGLWPDPAKHLPRPPNNHLQYALTWYGLAAALAVVFMAWSRKVLRE
jgi:surfeit locus 1 family protein